MERKGEEVRLPKMQDPYLSSKEVNLVFNLPAVVNNFIKVWKPVEEISEAFRYLVEEEHQTGRAFELLNIKHPRNVPDFLYEYSRREQAEWILELSSYPPLGPEMRRFESLVIIAGQIQTFLDALDLPHMGENFKTGVALWLLSKPVRELRSETMKYLCGLAGFEMVERMRGGLSERVEDNDTEIVCVITQLYALLKNPDGAHPAVLGTRGALMAHNYALIREARDIVLPGWGEGRED